MSRAALLSLLFPALGAVLFGGCSAQAQRAAPAFPIEWTAVDSINARLPEGVRVYAGRNDTLPLRAWYARIETSAPPIRTHVVVSDDASDNRETVSSFAADLGACLAVNGGYFTMEEVPARHVGLLRTADTLVAPATNAVERDSVGYETARAALGIGTDGSVDVAWATTRGDTLYAWPVPPLNRPGRQAVPMQYVNAAPWSVREALGAGPALVVNGTVRVTSDEEVFFGTSIPKVHPRTAAGRTADGDLLLVVVDGRQAESRGVDLEELAAMMLDLGAVEALNLDGGGSSTFVAGGVRLNRPTGGDVEREVMSAVVTHCE